MAPAPHASNSAPAPAAPAPIACAPACLNCGALLPEPRPRFCGQCGQETNLLPPTLAEFLQQFGGAYLSTEGALWRTLALLLFKPGELTRRYLAGRRKHYVLPLRLYLTISLLTLLVLRLGAFSDVQTNLDNEASVALSSRRANVTVLDFGAGRRAGLKAGTFYCEGLPPWLCSRLQSRLDLDAKALLRELQLWPERFIGAWGTAMFLLVPLFAAAQKLAYLGRGLRYTEHLVYALHLHSFWFLALLCMLLPHGLAKALALFAMPWYALWAARRVYGGGWWATLARALPVALLYGLVLTIALGVVALVSFFG